MVLSSRLVYARALGIVLIFFGYFYSFVTYNVALPPANLVLLTIFAEIVVLGIFSVLLSIILPRFN